MIPKEILLSEIRRLDVQHRGDGDGGYALVDDIVAYSKTLADAERNLITEILIQLVNDQDPNLWGVALESLVRCVYPSTGPTLFHSVQQQGKNDEWYDQVFLALLRLRYEKSANKCVEYINKSLSNKRREVIPILAALCHVQLDSYLKIASRFLVDNVNTYPELIERYTSAFMRNLAEESEEVLSALLKAVGTIDKNAEKKIANFFVEYLNKPWLASELGLDRVELLKKAINH